ncbi:hypothetical protein COCNU_01G020120 [Cocos nucifera]|uniref:ABC transporter D family member 1 n=1 Tax=Cocos nucifera TaxID=13894 RepID=A0A8K0MVX1_COCNU|nr:hypothetical protein COCNU_01G020120 [Cocos nucifera]
MAIHPFNALIIVNSQQFDYVLIFLFQRKLQRLRYGIFANRRTFAVVTSVLVAGGTVAYVQLRLRSRSMRSDSSVSHSASGVSKENFIQNGVNVNSIKRASATLKSGGLRSLHVLSAILLSQVGPVGMRNLLALVVTASSLFSTSKYLTGVLGLQFREILTDLVHADYFENMVYYKISHVDGRITNPEQRIVSDIPRFCSELSDLIQDDLTALTDGVLYTYRLCSYASPKYVFWMLAYVVGAGAIIRNFSPSFGKLMSKEQQLEGDYRQLHSRLRTHAESVAFYGGEKREASHIQLQFESLIRHLNLVLHDTWWFGMIQDLLLKYLGATVAVVLIIEPFFAGNLQPDASILGKAEMLSNLRYHTSVIISLFQSLASLSTSFRRLNRLSGYADRIHELIFISRELSSDATSLVLKNASSNYITEASYIEFAGVKVVTPRGNVLVDNLCLKVESGSNLLITGPNGSGKSSLFRVLGGLWPLLSGYIVKPGIGSDLNKEIFYVPQRPYTAVGTLHDQLIYPLTANRQTEPLTLCGMFELLKNVDLEYLLERYPLEKEINWGDELSLGEQQRLGMARLFYHKPKFAILDECTSAVTTDMEERFCAKVREMGTSCITISHRPALVAFHDIILSLDGEGGWNVHFKRDDSSVPTEIGSNLSKSYETDRRSDALAVQRAFATTGEVFHVSYKPIDADQRMTHDVEKLTTDLSGLVTGMVKPSVDILWFTWRMKLLTGHRGVAILYAYMLLGLGFLRIVAPEFGDLASQEQELEGTFRFMHSRLHTHAESVAFFGGGSREKAMVHSRFRELINHSKILLWKKSLYGVLDDFITKQLPHNVTWGLSLLYAMEHRGDRASTSAQGELAPALRFLASVVSQSFLAFGDILELHKKFLELSGGINRIFELDELLDAAQSSLANPLGYLSPKMFSCSLIIKSTITIMETNPFQVSVMAAAYKLFDEMPKRNMILWIA